MPVDPTILLKYDPPQKPQRPPREGLAALIIAVAGPLLQGLCFLLADGSPPLIRAFVIATGIFAVLIAAYLLYIGWQDSGLIGALYEYRHPLGSLLSGEQPPSWIRFAIGWNLVLACILAVILLVRTPGAVPQDWLEDGANSSLRDQLPR